MELYYDDGYVAQGIINKLDGLGELPTPLNFTYRPMGATDVNRYVGALQAANDDGLAQLQAALIAKQVKSWNLKDREKKPVPLTAECCGRLNTVLAARLSAIVQGRLMPDVGGINAEQEAKN